ncbi:MAG: response regulator transcription factor [Clostridiales bacterium]|nr:response regulator transcription factor [Clostridiales bacterium]HCH68574.1 DNA-binding response regulator [Clostridiales bacterium]
MSKLLIVDDESAIRTLIVKYATYEGYEVEEAENGMQAVEKCKKEDYSLVILDIMMPELDGFSAGREIKKLHPNLPIILLSARGEEYDRINGFEIGADDYVVKPFSPKELMLRVSAILKRVKKSPETTTNFFRLGGLSVDFTARIVKIDGKRIELSPKEYELLFYMIRNANIALTREKLICEVWGYDFYGDDRTLDTHIKLLRRSLGEYSRYIVTLRGVGYRFDTNQ